MKVTTYEATVEDGRIKLPDEVQLPEKTRVYVVVPSLETDSPIHVRSPRLADPEDAARFVMEVSEDI